MGWCALEIAIVLSQCELKVNAITLYRVNISVKSL